MRRPVVRILLVLCLAVGTAALLRGNGAQPGAPPFETAPGHHGRLLRGPMSWVLDDPTSIALGLLTGVHMRLSGQSILAALAPAKFGIRPSAPGKRDTPSRSIAFQTSRQSTIRKRRARYMK